MPIVLIIAVVILLGLLSFAIKGLSFLILQLFKNPWVNSIFFIILNCAILVLIVCLIIKQQTVSTFSAVLIITYSAAIVDCIRDLKMAREYYLIDSENLADSSFETKSVWSFFTLGIARAVYILFICPIMALHAIHCVNSTMNKEKIVSGFPVSFGYHGYKVRKYVIKCLTRGKILENKSTVEENTQISGRKISRGKPTKFIPKLTEIFTSDGRHRKRQRKRDFMTNLSETHAWVYIDGRYFLKCQQTFADFMSTRGMLSIVDIVHGLENANLIDEIRYKNDAEVKFFVAYVLDMLVLLGKLEEMNVNDVDVFDNRQYKHVSGKAINSTDLSNDPRFEL